jgi:hypothetical protein
MDEFELYNRVQACLAKSQFPFNQVNIVISEIEDFIKKGGNEPTVTVFTF